jgi:hypothetical protein
MRVRLLAVVTAAFLLAGCVAPTSYRSSVSVTPINADTVRIVATGNTFTSPSAIDDYARLKAAEETLARGYDGFEIINENDNVIEGHERVEGGLMVGTVPVPVTIGQMPTHTSTQTFTVQMFKGPEPKNPAQTWYDAKDMKQKMQARIAGDEAGF